MTAGKIHSVLIVINVTIIILMPYAEVCYTSSRSPVGLTFV